MKRRDFLKISALSGVSATLTGCGENPAESLIPLLNPPPHFSPGCSIHYATTCRECTAGCGLFVKTREGRAVKIEGNPFHPLNKGKVCAIGQAALQGLYSPSRLKGPLLNTKRVKEHIDWRDGIDLLVKKLKENLVSTQKRILFIGPPETGTLKQLIQNSLSAWGGGDYLSIDLSPVHSYKTANRITFNDDSIPHFDFSQVDTLINFGADFLESWLNPVSFSRDYTSFHAFKNKKQGRFVHVSPHLSLTGSNADLWHSCTPGAEHVIAFLLANRLSKDSKILSVEEKRKIQKWLSPVLEDFNGAISKSTINLVEQLAKEFQSKRCICLAGGNSSADHNATQLHVAVNLVNYLTGTINSSIRFGVNYQVGADSFQGISEKISQLQAGKYSMVLINNVNPVYALPQIPGLRSALTRAPFVVSFSTGLDETSEFATLHLPTNHYLESWGDGKLAKHLYTLQQPVMRAVPGYDTREIGDLLLYVSYLMNPTAFQFKNFQDYLNVSWQGLHKKKRIKSTFKEFWKSSLKQGGYYQEAPFKQVNLQKSLFNLKIKSRPVKTDDKFTLLAVNSNLQNGNGHTGNRYWLLETPHPISQVAWDSWVDIHPSTARKLGFSDGDLLELSSGYGIVKASARLFYGVEPNTIVMPTGFGRVVQFPDYESKKGRIPILDLLQSPKDIPLVQKKIGENVMSLFPDHYEEQSGDFLFSISNVSIRLLQGKKKLPTMDGNSRSHEYAFKGKDQSKKARGLVQTISSDETGRLINPIQKNKQTDSRTQSRENKLGFYEPIDKNVASHKQSASKTPPDYFDPYKWEMVIDLDRCTGCSACVVACYAENNIAVVGEERVQQGREMSWLRIERFFAVNSQTGKNETYLFPQMCAQCDNAGCEPVCPVSATYKTADGLNAMIYNRCIGSRYCSNNCIYSQRRFNWRTYEFPSPLHYQLNPDVSVREKGVMEKCTFCYQRIREKTLVAKQEQRVLKESEIKTACQQTCPTNAITFGNIKQPSSELVKYKSDQLRNYTQFESMNYQPAISYLKKVLHNNQKA